jgi:hypothetical protein
MLRLTADLNLRPNRYERCDPKRKTAKNLTSCLNLAESGSMWFQ